MFGMLYNLYSDLYGVLTVEIRCVPSCYRVNGLMLQSKMLSTTNLLETGVYLFLECFLISGVKNTTINNLDMHTLSLLIMRSDTL